MKNSLLFFIKTSFLREEARCFSGLLYYFLQILFENIADGCPFAQIAGRKSGACFAEIDLHDGGLFWHIGCQQLGVTEAECDSFFAAECIGDVCAVAGGLVRLRFNIKTGCLSLLKNLCALHSSNEIEQGGCEISGDKDGKNGENVD